MGRYHPHRAGVRSRGQAHHRARLAGRVAHHDAYIGDASVANGLDPIKQDRLIGNRDQLLGACMGYGPESRTLSSAKDYSLDLDQLLSGHTGRVIEEADHRTAG